MACCWCSLASARACQVAERRYRTSRVCSLVLFVYFNFMSFHYTVVCPKWLRASGRRGGCLKWASASPSVPFLIIVCLSVQALCPVKPVIKGGWNVGYMEMILIWGDVCVCSFLIKYFYLVCECSCVAVHELLGWQQCWPWLALNVREVRIVGWYMMTIFLLFAVGEDVRFSQQICVVLPCSGTLRQGSCLLFFPLAYSTFIWKWGAEKGQSLTSSWSGHE